MINFIVLFMFLTLAQKRYFHVEAADSCKELDYLNCIPNKALIGHVFKTLKIPAPGLEICQNECFHAEQCLSYNLGPIDGAIRTCELNVVDHLIYTTALKTKAGYEYCTMQSPCASNPYPGHKPVCFPNYDFNSYNCRGGLWTAWPTWPCTCPTKTRTRKCINPKTNQVVNDCDPGETEQTINCTFTEDISACKAPLGMESKAIPDARITSSGYYTPDSRCKSIHARLNYPRPTYDGHAWCAKTHGANQYIQIDLGSRKTVTQVATQGRPTYNQYVKTFSLAFSNDATMWVDYVGNEQCIVHFFANVDGASVVTNRLPIPASARYVRVSPVTFQGHPSIRLEFYGC